MLEAHLARIFSDESHRAFFWSGGEPAALLVHGFPGTPAEFRPLAEALHGAGWTVQGLLLPGFGPDIATLTRRRYEEWVGATAEALRALRSRHRPLLLVGYSMGSAVVLSALAKEGATPDTAVALLAPFWRLGTPGQRVIFSLLKPFFRNVRPFRGANLRDPRLRAGLADFLPELDLDDPDVQTALRDFRVPMTLMEQVFHVGQSGRAAADMVHVQALIVQGRHDEVVRPADTRKLLQQLPGPVQYRELDHAHDLLSDTHPGWQHVRETVLQYAQQQLPSKAPG